jgi:hypothetical protein
MQLASEKKKRQPSRQVLAHTDMRKNRAISIATISLFQPLARGLEWRKRLNATRHFNSVNIDIISSGIILCTSRRWRVAVCPASP